ncbi:transcriptional regulator [Methanomethylovorans hollandica DSM 15978]|jgi:Lrp/AsnC family transcriptional regulator for asnA, asnC and gidA|uniref:Transcriptional regulator n=1 Tax=Methanomethylovorans hollandica (strain DSM 15978 / NBRC 107637 / DMS1) TaxID=867904 RepID=L0L078_METHD|nr:Lrp/AsnC family transcriptional regulator [Methanomethylovorans hollandica]AGB49664.1 transcriptional regulator [Methanomethylovorans hollandica DSM 15978]
MDDLDFAILEHLTHNSRIHSTEIASNLGLATSTVHKRIEKLQSSGVVKQFTILIDPMSIGLNVTTYIGLRIEQSKRISVINKLKNINDVLEIYELLEPYDLLLKVRTCDIHSLKENVIHVLTNIDGVLESNSLLTTKCHKEKTCIMLRK